MSEETYEGWTNRETWAVALHINNDQGWQESVHEAIRQKLTRAHEDYSGEISERERATWAAAAIRENVEEMLGAEAPEGIYDPAWFCSNMLPVLHDIGSLWRVNWTELGASFLEDVEDN